MKRIFSPFKPSLAPISEKSEFAKVDVESFANDSEKLEFAKKRLALALEVDENNIASRLAQRVVIYGSQSHKGENVIIKSQINDKVVSFKFKSTEKYDNEEALNRGLMGLYQKVLKDISENSKQVADLLFDKSSKFVKNDLVRVTFKMDDSTIHFKHNIASDSFSLQDRVLKNLELLDMRDLSKKTAHASFQPNSVISGSSVTKLTEQKKEYSK